MVPFLVQSNSLDPFLSVDRCGTRSGTSNEIAASTAVLGTQLAQLVEDYYVDLDTVRERRGFDPVRALRGAQHPDHLHQVFEQLRDRHSLLHLPHGSDVDGRPPVFQQAQASGLLRLGVQLEASSAGSLWRVWVTQRDEALTGDIEVGDQVTHWNGTPIELAATALGRQLRGASRAACRQLGLRSLAQRMTGTTRVPSEDWVWLTRLRRENSSPKHVKLHWGSRFEGADPAPSLAWKEPLAASLSGDGFRCGVLRTEPSAVSDTDIPFQSFHRTSTLYLRLFALHAWSDFKPLLAWLRHHTDRTAPRAQLIVDLRANAGGEVATAERFARLFGVGSNRPETERLVRYRHRSTSPYQTGSVGIEPSHSQFEEPLQLGPIAVIVDALTFSAAEVLTALLLHGSYGSSARSAGTTVIGADPSTGGGTANVWCFDSFRRLEPGTRPALPRGVDLQLATRHIDIRPAADWQPLKPIAVDHQVSLSKRDLFSGNFELLTKVAQLLQRSSNVPGRSVETTTIDVGPVANASKESR